MAEKINGPIGVFDSGIGGLSLVRALRRELPNESILYFADLQHLPYGEKSFEQVNEYSLQVARFLRDQGAKLILVACSTASAVSRETLTKNLNIPVVTILNPFFRQEIIQQSKKKKVGVLSTELTHKSQTFAHWISAGAPYMEVVSSASSELVNQISYGDLDSEKIKYLIGGLVTPLIKEDKVDEIILGCTHFNFVESQFKAVLPEKVNVVSAPKPTAEFIHSQLRSKKLLTDSIQKGELKILTSAKGKIFSQFVENLFHMEEEVVDLVASLK